MRLRLFTLLFSCLVAGLAKADERPNILLLMAEDLSSRVGAFGDTVAQTPRLDALALEGVRYQRVFTTAGVCAPSRAAHILGMHQISTGTQHMRTSSRPDGGYVSVPPPEVKAYPELLRASGYYTFTDTKLDYQFSSAFGGSGPFTIWDLEGDAKADWRGREPGQPFFGIRNFIATHESGVFTPLGNMPNSVIHLVMQFMRWWNLEESVEAVTDPDAVILPPYYPDTPTVRRDVARHYDNIAYMDSEVGVLLDRLDTDGLADSTIVIWTTDHGDGLPRGKRDLYDSGIHVPMIIRWPEKFRPEGVEPGSLDTRLISFVDLAPTVLKLAGVELPAYLQGRDFSAPDAHRRQYVYASRDRIDEVPDRQRAVRDDNLKYIRSWSPEVTPGHALAFRDNIAMVREMRLLFVADELAAAQRKWFEPAGEEQLYDLDVDPFELNNVATDPNYRSELWRMRAALDRHLARVGDWSDEPESAMVARFKPGGRQPVTPAPQASLQAGHLHLAAGTEYASLAYRFDGGPWRVYGEPVSLPADVVEIEARSVRYGWEPSEIVVYYP